MERETIKNYLEEIVKTIKAYNVYEIILFGSVSKEKYDDESDIDLFIVLDIDKIPETYEEKMKLKLEIRKALRKINKKISLDLLIYTKKEYEIMKEEKSSFFEELIRTGKTLYEKAS